MAEDEFDALINSTMRAIFMEETTVRAEVEPIIKPTEETPEQRDARLKREDYARRNAEAVKERERILRDNKVIGPDETLDVDMEAALRQRCCF